MLKNHFINTIRYLRSHKTYTVVNIIGMISALCVVNFALLYINFEMKYDTYHEKADRIYRLVTDIHSSQGVTPKSSLGGMAPAIQSSFPEIEKVTRVFPDHLIVQKEGGDVYDEKIAYADAALFAVFTLPIIHGNPKNLLNTPNTIVLSVSAAKRYFGTENAVGQALIINGNLNNPALVVGIMEDMPLNSHFRVDMLVSLSALGDGWLNNWKRFFFYTYILLPENINTNELSEKITSLVDSHLDSDNLKYKVSLEPLTDVYLRGDPRGSKAGKSVHGSYQNIYIFSIVAVFILFMACFNFINLTTAFTLQQRREIGIRKIMGASKWQIMVQLTTVNIVLSLLAFSVATLLYSGLLPLFNQLAGKMISHSLWSQPVVIGYGLLTALLAGLVSGIIPAFIASRLDPIKSLNEQISSSFKGMNIRKLLMVLQFAIALLLSISAIVVYAQINYMQQHTLGFKKERMMVIDFQFDQEIVKRGEMIKHQLSSLPGVNGASFSSSIPGRSNHSFPTKIENNLGEQQEFQADAYFIDNEFLTQFEIEIIAGRDFSNEFSSDLKDALILNHAAVSKLGYMNPEDVIGKTFSQLGRQGQVIGVVRDFHFHSSQEYIRPLTLRRAPGFYTFITLDISPNTPIIPSVKRKWQELNTDMPMVYFFADQAYDAQYAREQRFGSLFAYLAGLAILISCLGLFGLSVFSTTQRTKEIGIRKVLGGSVIQIMCLFIKDFFLPILLAFAIGGVAASVALNEWLSNFAYRVTPSWQMYVFAGFTLLFIALLTVGFQTIKAAVANPVETLRNE